MKLTDKEFADVNVDGLDRVHLQEWAKHYGLKANGTSDNIRKELRKKQKAVTAVVSKSDKVSSGATTSRAPVPRMQDAPKMPTKPTPQQYKIWRRELLEWRMYFEAHYDQQYLMVNFKSAISDDVKAQIYGEIPAGGLTFDSVMSILDRDYAGLAVLEDFTLRTEYRRLERLSTESLREFIARYRQLRAKALLAGVITPSTADVHDLLVASKLAKDEHTSILRELKRAVEQNPEVNQLEKALSELQLLEQVDGFRADVHGEPTEAKAFIGFGGKGSFGGGKGGKGGKPGDWHCSCGALVFASRSSCYKCGLQRPGGKGGGKGGKKGKKGKKGGAKGGKPWVQKEIWKKKEEPVKVKKEEPEGSEDWKCKKCGHLVFGSHKLKFCGKCGEPRAVP
jgi:hypothetical protein